MSIQPLNIEKRNASCVNVSGHPQQEHQVPQSGRTDGRRQRTPSDYRARMMQERYEATVSPDSRTRRMQERYQASSEDLSRSTAPSDDRTRLIQERYQASCEDLSRSTTPHLGRLHTQDTDATSAKSNSTWITRKPNPSVKSNRTQRTDKSGETKTKRQRPRSNTFMYNGIEIYTVQYERPPKGISGRFKKTMNQLFGARKENAGILDRAGPAVGFNKDGKKGSRFGKLTKRKEPPVQLSRTPIIAHPFASRSHLDSEEEEEEEPVSHRRYNYSDDNSFRIRRRAESSSQPPASLHSTRSRAPSNSSVSTAQRYQINRPMPMQMKNNSTMTLPLGYSSGNPQPRDVENDSVRMHSATPSLVQRCDPPSQDTEFEKPRAAPRPPVPRVPGQPSNNLPVLLPHYTRRRSRSFGGYQGQLNELLREPEPKRPLQKRPRRVRNQSMDDQGNDEDEGLDEVTREARGVARKVGPEWGYLQIAPC